MFSYWHTSIIPPYCHTAALLHCHIFKLCTSSSIHSVLSGYTKTYLPGHWSLTPVLSRYIPDINEDESQRYTGKSVNTFRFLSSCSEIPKKRYSSYCCAAKHSAKTLMSEGCEGNKDIRPFLVSGLNLYARNASGVRRLSHLVISWKINPRHSPEVYKVSANDVQRKENSSRIDVHAIRDKTFSSAEIGVFFPHSSNFSALRLDESRRVLCLAGNEYLNQSARFRDKLDEIESKQDRFRRAWPSPSQTTAVTRYIYSKIKNNEWNSDLFFAPPVYRKIYDINFSLRHSNNPRRLAQRYGHLVLPMIPELLTRVDRTHEPRDFWGDSERSLNNCMLRDSITAKVLSNALNEVPIILDSEEQLDQQISSVFGAHRGSLDLPEHNGTRRAPTAPNSLIDLELSLSPSIDTVAKYEEKRMKSMSPTTAYRGEKDSWPYFWNSSFPLACEDEAKLNLEKVTGNRQIPSLFDYPDNSFITEATDQSQVVASPVFFKDPKYTSSCLYAKSYAISLAKNKTARLVSRQNLCQSVPIQDSEYKSCVTENLELCGECAR